MDHLKNFLAGARQVLVLDTRSAYVRPSRNDFSKDMALLQGDARRVACDMNKSIKQYPYGEQTYHR
ncbi:MAG: hypothetical protein Q8Q50_02730 [Methylobacter sp.]|nr:hypothetical protein [Methylobacter sp.]